jgi:zinc transport system ATP-binding protein
MNTPAIRASKLSFSYENQPVLHDLSFEVSAGDFVSLIGSNGAGKSTLLRLLLHELEPDSGMIELLGMPLSKFRDWYRIGYVSQNGISLAEGFPATAAEIVALGLYHEIGPLRFMNKSHRQRVQAALSLVEMADYANRGIGTLSGGQIQRVLIARALAGKSELLLLDEPTTGVDSAASTALYQLLAALCRDENLAVLMVTHDIERAEAYSNRTIGL